MAGKRYKEGPPESPPYGSEALHPDGILNLFIAVVEQARHEAEAESDDAVNFITSAYVCAACGTNPKAVRADLEDVWKRRKQ